MSENHHGKLTQILLCLFMTICLFGCSSARRTEPLENYPIEHELEFGGAYIKMSIDDFLDMGYRFGDCVRVEFSNGYVYENLPFYNGYFVSPDETLLVGYPGYPYIKVAVYNGEDMWYEAGLSDTDTATVTLVERGRYLEIQQAHDVQQENERAAYESDEIFANFRPLNFGNLRDNLIYRSSSPCDNTYNRASYVQTLMEQHGIKLVIDLSDTPEELASIMSSDPNLSPYYQTLYNEGKIMTPVINTRYSDHEIKSKIVTMLVDMVHEPGPYMIHCALGKDRTGFIALLLEMLAGASYEDMRDDYMKTYENFYHISVNNEKQKYETIVSESYELLLQTLVPDETADLKTADLVPYAEAYLKEGGMSDEDLDFLKSVIMNYEKQR